MNLIKRMTFMIRKDKKIDYFYQLLEEFLSQFETNSDIVNQLMKFQNSYVIQYDEFKSYPKIENFDYDFRGFIIDNTVLQTTCTYKFYTNEDISITETRFLENIYFKRRRNFGKSLIAKVM